MIQFLLYGQNISMNEKLTLIPITFGMGYATVYDVSLNLVGFGKNYRLGTHFCCSLLTLFPLFDVVLALCAIIATALAQIFTNTYQKSLDCNAMQLLYHTAPYIALVSPLLPP